MSVLLASSNLGVTRAESSRYSRPCAFRQEGRHQLAQEPCSPSPCHLQGRQGQFPFPHPALVLKGSERNKADIQQRINPAVAAAMASKTQAAEKA